MILKVNTTRITLLNLKRELKVARNGHKLLKDKRDGLMKQFMSIIQETRKLRSDVEDRLGSAFDSYVRANAMTPSLVMENAFLLPNAKIELDVEVRNVMSVKIPKFSIKKEGSAFSYGFVDTTGDLDNAVRKFDDVFVDIIRLAELENSAEALAEELDIDFTVENELNEIEKQHYRAALAEIDSHSWVYGNERSIAQAPIQEGVYRSPGGMIRATVALDLQRGLLKQVWLTGDFFVHPSRMIMDLEAALKDTPVRMLDSRVRSFFASYEAKLYMLQPDDFLKAISLACTKRGEQE